MCVKLLTEHHLEFLSLKGGCIGSSESTLVKMPHCWKSHVTANLFSYEFSHLVWYNKHRMVHCTYSQTCVKRPLSKRQEIGFQGRLSLNAGQKYCRMLQREHSAILLTFIKLPFVIKTFVLCILEWPFYTGFTVSRSQRLKFPDYLPSVPIDWFYQTLMKCRILWHFNWIFTVCRSIHLRVSSIQKVNN